MRTLGQYINPLHPGEENVMKQQQEQQAAEAAAARPSLPWWGWLALGYVAFRGKR